MGTAAPVSYRPLDEGEHELLLEAALGNFNWKTPLFTPEQVRARPDLARYTDFAPARGDFGVVAETHAGSVGVA